MEEIEGDGEEVQRQQNYILAIRLVLNKGEIIHTPDKCLSHSVDNNVRIHDDGFYEHLVRIDRENLISGIFYALQGMRVCGYRKVSINPHLAYGKEEIPGVVPPNAKITVEIKVLR